MLSTAERKKFNAANRSFKIFFVDSYLFHRNIIVQLQDGPKSGITAFDCSVL